MKKLISALLCAAISVQAVCLPANAYNKDKPAEYAHTDEDSVKNDKLYIYGYYVEDTKVWLWEHEIIDPNDYYGVDENGEIYVRGPEEEDPYYPLSDKGFEVGVYLIKNGKKEYIKGYYTDLEYSDPWNTGLKPYTTYTFQQKIIYPIYHYTKENGEWVFVDKVVWSDPIKIRTCPKKTGFTFSKAGRNTVRLRWKAVKCEGYKLQQYNAKKKKWATVRTLPKSKTSAKLTGLKANTKFKFRVVPYGHVADERYPRAVKGKDAYSGALFGKPSKAVVVRTKK